MKQLSFILALFLVSDFSAAQSSAVVREISAQAQVAVIQFFVPSGRRIEKMVVESYSRMNSSNSDFLVELNVVAQSPRGPRTMEYHCGVFIKKVNAKWQARHTECEALN